VFIALSLIAWLAVVLVMLAVCRMAARGEDHRQAAHPEQDRGLAIEGVAIWDRPLAVVTPANRERPPAPMDRERITAPGAR
jgi:hypothetical protein